jgi:L-rhamnose mutarotase
VTKRICFKLRLNPEMTEEYKELHANVWPEMREVLHASGWNNYTLFLEPGGVLIGYVECEDFTAAQAAMAVTEINAKWQASMSKFFIGIEGGPDEAIVPIEEVFHLD